MTRFTDQQVRDYLINNPGMSDAQIVDAMKKFGVSADQMSSATGVSRDEIDRRMAAVQAPTPSRSTPAPSVTAPRSTGTTTPVPQPAVKPAGGLGQVAAAPQSYQEQANALLGRLDPDSQAYRSVAGAKKFLDRGDTARYHKLMGMVAPSILRQMNPNLGSFDASNLVHMLKNEQQDTRDWSRILSASDPWAAAQEATRDWLGGITAEYVAPRGQGTDILDRHGRVRLKSGTGINLGTLTNVSPAMRPDGTEDYSQKLLDPGRMSRFQNKYGIDVLDMVNQLPELSGYKLNPNYSDPLRAASLGLFVPSPADTGNYQMSADLAAQFTPAFQAKQQRAQADRALRQDQMAAIRNAQRTYQLGEYEVPEGFVYDPTSSSKYRIQPGAQPGRLPSAVNYVPVSGAQPSPLQSVAAYTSQIPQSVPQMPQMTTAPAPAVSRGNHLPMNPWATNFTPLPVDPNAYTYGGGGYDSGGYHADVGDALQRFGNLL